ncbi:polysaccharide deacetylase family protein [Alkalicella caledoniensis]|uniref:Polysaccharide deacetylase family protein n=1 Tax=Alkalicella caledoniensis TaxID=2731377 RepID=A0A7G9WCR0_ALKCA|nr:polysaccharide deacetylase family protein [Alkalicella caledoniensis]QNO16472.1 polysaccharide deacetylase family protein [Alkalicella caledoniensis]
MSVYIRSITLTKLLAILVVAILCLSAMIFVAYSIHNSFTTVSADVTMGRFNLGGKKKDEIMHYLESISSEFSFEAQDAYIDSETKSLIPHLNGCQLDIDATAEKIVGAKKGESVDPVIHTILPLVTIKDFSHVPIYQGNPIRKQASLVINISWGNEFNDYLQEMLDILKDQGVKGNFFLVGKWAEKYPNLVKQIHQEGHILANHGYSDPYMSKISIEEISIEINKTNDLIKEATGYTPIYFSPPYGEKDTRIFEQSTKDSMVNVLWSLDTIDWQRPGIDAMADRILNNMHNGAIILMHNTEQTPAALKKIIIGIKEKGYEIVDLDTMLSPDYYLQNIKQKISIEDIPN